MKRFAATGLAALALVFTGACSDDADVDADISADTDSGDAERYCELAAELDAGTEMPTDEQFEELAEAAPAEIEDDVRTLIDAIKDGSEESEEAQEAEANLRAWESENCDDADGGTEGGAEKSENRGTTPEGGEGTDESETTTTTEGDGTGVGAEVTTG